MAGTASKGQVSRFQYAAAQGARVAWYLGHYAAVNRLRGPLTREGEAPFTPSGPIPDRKDFVNAIRRLFERDYRNIEAGIYRAPRQATDPRALVDKGLRFLLDARRVDERRLAKRHSEVRTVARDEDYPRYYLQNFHFQTGGWLSEDSAELYDTQVEALFAGTADAMRRQALVPIAAYLDGRDQRSVTLADVGCGTGRFLYEVKRNWPRLDVTGLDLSPAYLEKTARTLRRWGRVTCRRGAAEDMPLADASQDIVTASYLFHELPPKVRRDVMAEIARVVKPGGLFVLIDALQAGDEPAFDGLLEFFPIAFHEPYFSTYLQEDFGTAFAAAGLVLQQVQTGYLTKVMSFEKRG